MRQAASERLRAQKAEAAERAKAEKAEKAALAKVQQKGKTAASSYAKKLDVAIASLQKTLRMPGHDSAPPESKDRLRECISLFEAQLKEAHDVIAGRVDAKDYITPTGALESVKKHQALFIATVRAYGS